MIKVGFIRKTWALAQRIVPGSAPDADVRAPPDGRKDPEEQSSGAADRNSLPAAFEASAFSLPKVVENENEVDAASLTSQMDRELLEHPTDMNASLDVLAEQMLTLVKVVSAQEQEIKALKARCQQLDEHDQAIMVAFTTFFHVLAAKRIARLGDISAILHDITRVAQQQAYPQDSILFLQRLAAMLHEQTRAQASEAQRRRSPEAENNAA